MTSNRDARAKAQARGWRVIDQADCKCHKPPLLYTDYRDVKQIDADGFYTLTSDGCRYCGATWLRVHYENAYSESGRWWRAIVPPDEAQAATVTTALDIIDDQPWHLMGGSYFRSTGIRRNCGVMRP